MASIVWTPRSTSPDLGIGSSEHWIGTSFINELNARMAQVPLPTSFALAAGLPAGQTLSWAQWVNSKNICVARASNAALNSHTMFFLTNGYQLGAQYATPAFTGYKPHETSMATYNPHVYITSASGIIKIADIATAPVVSLLAGSPTYRMLVTHLSRLVGAKATGNLLRIGWTVAGNPEDWTTTTSGAGTVDFVLDDEFMDMFVVENAIVVLGRSTVQVGYLTGTISPTYRFEQIIDNYEGPIKQGCATLFNNILYYVGRSNVFALDNRRQVALGDEISSYIAAAAEFESEYRPHVVPSIAQQLPYPKAKHHHLVLVPRRELAASDLPFPLLALNLATGKWSILDSENCPLHSWVQHPSHGYGPQTASVHIMTTRIGTNVVKYRKWDNATANSYTISSPTLTVDASESLYIPDVTYITYIDTGVLSVTLTITSENRGAISTTNFTVSLGSATASGRRLTKVVPTRCVGGQNFQIKLVGNHIKQLVLEQIKLNFVEAGSAQL